jgi:ABC-type Fe3+-hydroxamate transport system, periplasmic component
MHYFRKYALLIVLLLFTIIGHSQVAGRIVSLAPSVTNMIYLMGAQDKLVGCTNYCLEGVKDKKSIVASAIEVNVEKVLLLKPDIVFATSLTKPSVKDAMKNLGIKVIAFKSATSYDEICEQFILIGKYAGKEPLARKIVKSQKKRLDSLRLFIPKGKNRKYFLR